MNCSMANLTGKAGPRREPERQDFVIWFLSSDSWSDSLGRVALHKPQLADARLLLCRSDPRLARYQCVPDFAPI